MKALAQREEKAVRLNQLTKLYPGQAIVSIRLNIPGPNKKGEWSQRLFEVTQTKFTEMLKENRIPHQFVEAEFTEHYYEHLCLMVCDGLNIDIKKMAIDFEDQMPFGRFVDIDVLGTSRESLGASERKCFLCDDLAFNCARSQKHEVSALIQFMVLKTERL